MAQTDAQSYVLDRVAVFEDGCWVWLLACDRDGYGFAHRPGSPSGIHVRAHRLSYESFVGPIPSTQQLDHLCRKTCCVNPRHLEPVSNRENTLRGTPPDVNRLRQLSKTSCPSGHTYDEMNTYFNGRGARICRACNRQRARVRRKGTT